MRGLPAWEKMPLSDFRDHWQHLLPDELKDENPMKIGRWVDSVYDR
jgi:hypothetical protein